jgi:hypothetical protein
MGLPSAPPNPPTFISDFVVRPDYPIEAGVKGIYWVEGTVRNTTPLSNLSVNVSATDPDTATNLLTTSYSGVTLYDQPFDTSNINQDTSRIVWTQGGPNPQTFSLNARLNSPIFQSGVYTFPFLANDGFSSSMPSGIYVAVDDPGINDRPYIKPIQDITLSEEDLTVLNLDQFGIDPDRNINTIGMITYSIVSVSPAFSGVKVCGLNPLTNNSNYILTVSPKIGDVGGAGIPQKTVLVTLRATDSGSPSLSFDRVFRINILPKAFAVSITNNPQNLESCFSTSGSVSSTSGGSSGSGDDDTILTPDAAPFASLLSVPQIFDPFALDLKKLTESITSIFSSPDDQVQLFLDRKKKKNPILSPDALNNQFISRNLIIGGKAYLSFMLNAPASISDSDLSNISYSLTTTPENQPISIMANQVAIDLSKKQILLEITIPDDVRPGDANLILSIRDQTGRTRYIGRATVSLLPAVTLKGIKAGWKIGKPKITKAQLYKLSSSNPKRKNAYILIMRGEHFLGIDVNASNRYIKSPIKKQPFSLITFVNNDGLVVQRVRVTKRRTRMRVIFSYDNSVSSSPTDLRYFTVSTLGGQITGSIDMKDVRKKSIPYGSGIKLPPKSSW